MDAIGQVGQVRHRANTIKQGSWPTQSNLANFIYDVRWEVRIRIGGPRRLDRTLRISNANELGQVAQVRYRGNTIKQGSWPTQSKLANFICDVLWDARIGIGGPRRLDRTLRISNANEPGQVGQVRHRVNTTKQGSWPTRSKLTNFICDVLWDARIGIGGPRRLDRTLRIPVCQ